MDEEERASMTVKSTIKPLGKRQIFTMRRASLEKRSMNTITTPMMQRTL